VCHQAAAELEHNSQLQQPSLLSASWQTLATTDAGWQQLMPAAAHPATAAQGNMHGARFNHALSGGAAAGKIALNAAVTQVRQRMAAVPNGGAAPASTGAVDECTVASEQLNPGLSAQQHQQQHEPATATPRVCSMSSSSGGSSTISSNSLCGTAVALTACHGQNCVMATPQQNQLKISWLQRLLLQQQGQLQKSQPRLPLKDLLLQPMALQPQQKPWNSTPQQQLQQQLVQQQLQQLQQSEQQQLLPLEPQAQLLFQAPQQLAQQPQPLLPSQQQQVQAPQQLAQQQMPLLQSEEQQQVQAPHQLAQQPQPPLLSPKQQLPPQHLEQQEQQQQPQSEQPHLSIQDQEDIRLLIEALRRRTVCHRSLQQLSTKA
jgi:mediator of RNA polymerase II transcription subunit 25